ncbi:MAG: phenylalanyl-tRNA synthetase beta chain [Microgenomates group bacterium LiPW_16]|nr:MAG: phenylalanyl-tRNA synthetase beta chain [Microgenomates group bacterium LiPW_16]
MTEVASYSMISEELLTNADFEPENYLKITNPLTADLVCMRPSLIPSILQIISQNQANSPDIRIFEIANIYIPQQETDLPEEIPVLTAGQTGNKFFETKGIFEALFEDLGIKDYKFMPPTSLVKIFHPGKTAEVFVKDKPVGIFGEVNPQILRRFKISTKVIIFDLEFNSLVKHATRLKK